jgi:hypothetical protein
LKLTTLLSKEGWLKLGFFLVLLAAAWVYDSHHQGDDVRMEASRNTGEEKASPADHFYCTLHGSLSLKTPVQKTVLKKSFHEKLKRFLMVRLKSRMVFLQKEEVRDDPHAFLASRNLLFYRHCHSGSPDGQPPA